MYELLYCNQTNRSLRLTGSLNKENPVTNCKQFILKKSRNFLKLNEILKLCT